MKFKYTQAEIEKIFVARRQQLASLEPMITLKLYNQLEHKINLEQQRFQKLLDRDKQHQATQAVYSFVLDPHYFEQKFFTKP